VTVLIAAILLSSCQLDWTSYSYGVDGLPVVSSVDDAWTISDKVKYVRDPVESFREPRETYLLMRGDCEDIAALMLALIEVSGLGTGYVTVIETRWGDHAVCEIEGRFCEAQCIGEYYDDPVVVRRYTLASYIRRREL